MYGRDELARLQRIRSLQRLGFSLDEIRHCLDEPDFAPLRVVEMHIARVDAEVEVARRLRDRLEAIARSLRAAETRIRT